MKEKDKASLIDYLEIVVKWRKFILRNVVIVTIAAVIISLLLPQKFTATATILPPNPQQQAMLGIISSNLPGGLSGLSGISGIIPGIATPSDLYAAIMQSGTVKSAIIKNNDLMKEFKAKKMTDALSALDDMTNIEITPEGIISVSVTYKNKHLAADIANSYIEELDKFNTETAMTVGKKYRIFIEQRLEETTDDLAKAEVALRNFQEKHRTVALEEEIISAIQTIAELKSQIILLEVKKGALSSSSRFDNPYLYDISKELRELKKQLGKIEFGEQDTTKKAFGAGFAIPFSELPEVSLEYARLLRDVRVQSEIYKLLTQQYEQAKIMELKDTPTVQPLDKAGPPEKRSFPKRRIIVLIALLCSFIFSFIYAAVTQYFQSDAINSETNKKLTHMWNIIKDDFHHFLQYLRNFFKK